MLFVDDVVLINEAKVVVNFKELWIDTIESNEFM